MTNSTTEKLEFEIHSGGFSPSGTLILNIRSLLNEPGDLSVLKDIYCNFSSESDCLTVKPRIARNPKDGWRAYFETPEVIKCIHRVEIFKSNMISLNKELENFLKMIFPQNDSEFEMVFLRQINRYGSSQNKFFVSKQICLNFKGNLGFRASAAIVMGYKAVEIGDINLQQEALNQVDYYISRMPECEFHQHPRMSGEQNLVSLLCVRFHLALSLMNKDEFISSLYSVEQLKVGLKSYFTPAHTLSICFSILAILLKIQGKNDELQILASDVLILFKNSVADCYFTPVLFGELEVCHRNVILINEILQSKRPKKSDYTKWASPNLRVNGPVKERLLNNLIEINGI
ncbi:hypothetical protein [Ensifer soli]|uniref:hypothetical protein n=1 Tax=Ciceribacter sp. sgz301302 TaxID=3342379 RepID=UPI0035B7EE01